LQLRRRNWEIQVSVLLCALCGKNIAAMELAIIGARGLPQRFTWRLAAQNLLRARATWLARVRAQAANMADCDFCYCFRSTKNRASIFSFSPRNPKVSSEARAVCASASAFLSD